MSNFTEWGVGPDGLMRPMRDGGWVEQFAADELVREMYQALLRAERKLRAYVGVCKGDKELTDTVLPMCQSALAKADSDPLTRAFHADGKPTQSPAPDQPASRQEPS